MCCNHPFSQRRRQLKEQERVVGGWTKKRGVGQKFEKRRVGNVGGGGFRPLYQLW